MINTQTHEHKGGGIQRNVKEQRRVKGGLNERPSHVVCVHVFPNNVLGLVWNTLHVVKGHQ